jgi:hypothetical protein
MIRAVRLWPRAVGSTDTPAIDRVPVREVRAMQDADLLIPLAEIAGVFVGFGALIAVRSGGASGRIEVGYTRGMVAAGLLTIVAALAPVTLGRYDLGEHETWALSSGLVLIGWVAFVAANARTPEYRANIAAEYAASGSRWRLAANLAAAGLFMLAAVLPPILVVLGAVPDLEPALYFTAVVMGLLMATTLLMGLVYEQRGPAVG